MAESFDIVSKIDLQEVSNAIQQALKEVHTRFDLKDSKSEIEMEGKDAIVLSSSDEYKLKAVTEILQSKLVKRGVPLKGLTYGTVEPAAGSRARRRSPCSRESPGKGERNCQLNQRFKEEGAGIDPGRYCAREQQGP